MKTVVRCIPQVAKALTAGAVTFGGSYAAAASEGVTSTEWVGIGVATLVALLGVWAVPNRATAQGRHVEASPEA